MEPEEVVELCEDFFSTLEGEEDYWVEIRGRARPAFKLVEVEVDDDHVTLLVEPAPGLDEDDTSVNELLDRALSQLSDDNEELTDYRISYKLDVE